MQLNPANPITERTFASGRVNGVSEKNVLGFILAGH